MATLQIISQILSSSYLDWIAFITAILQVIFAWKNKIINFYFGIVSVAIYSYLYFIGKLYAESLLNLYYLLMSIYGSYIWLKKDRSLELNLSITKSNSQDWKICLSIVFISFTILYTVIKSQTSSTVPFVDSIASALAWGGMWLLAKRKLENWLVLNVSNLIAIPLFYYKHFYLASLLSLILFIIAIMGYLDWRKEILISEKNI